jgi:hypothetical protein
MQHIKCQIIKKCQKIWETSGNFAHKYQILENDIIMILKKLHKPKFWYYITKYHLLKNDIKNINILKKWYNDMILYQWYYIFQCLPYRDHVILFLPLCHEYSHITSKPYCSIRNCWTEMLARSLGHIIKLVHFRSKR